VKIRSSSSPQMYSDEHPSHPVFQIPFTFKLVTFAPQINTAPRVKCHNFFGRVASKFASSKLSVLWVPSTDRRFVVVYFLTRFLGYSIYFYMFHLNPLFLFHSVVSGSCRTYFDSLENGLMNFAIQTQVHN
jgi:hypothetical protein